MTKVSTVLKDLAACLCAQIEEDGSASPCFCGVVPGGNVTPDYLGGCTAEKCGMAWVRLGSAYPSNTPGLAIEETGNCTSGNGIEVEMGLLRCAPMPDSRGNPPSAEVREAAFDQQVKDMLTMKRAIKCCSSLKPKEYVLNIYTPVGPEGDVLGGFWSLSIVVL